MVIDQNYINRTKTLKQEAMMYGGKVLAAFVANGDNGKEVVKNEMIVCSNIGRIIDDYEYSCGKVTDKIIEEIHDILKKIRDYFKRLCQNQDDFIDSPFIDEYIISEGLSQALVKTKQMDNLTESGSVDLITITAISGDILTLDILPVEAIKEKVDWFVLSNTAADISGSADPHASFLCYDVATKVVSFDFENKKVKVSNPTGFTVGDTIVLYTPYTNIRPEIDQPDYGIMGYSSVTAMTPGNMPPWVEFAREIFPGPVWYDKDDDEYLMLFSVNPKPNLLHNPKFYDSNGWQGVSSGWTISGGKLVAAGAHSTVYNDMDLPDDRPLLPGGRTYETSFDISDYSSGQIRIEIGTVDGTLRSSDGTHTEDISTVPGNGTTFKFDDGGFTFTAKIGNVSAMEKDPENKKAIGIARSKDLLDWTFDDDSIISWEDVSGLQKSLTIGSGYVEKDGYIYFTVMGLNSGMLAHVYIYRVKLDGSSPEYVGRFSEDGDQTIAVGFTYHNGLYHIVTSEIDGVNFVGRHYVSNDISSGYSNIADLYDTTLDANDSHFLESYAQSIILFSEPTFNKDTGQYSDAEELYALVFMTGQYGISGFKGRHVAGLMKYDPSDDTWSVLNKAAPEIVWPMISVLESPELFSCATEILGTANSIVKANGNAYLFMAMKNYKESTFGTNIYCFRFVDNR